MYTFPMPSWDGQVEVIVSFPDVYHCAYRDIQGIQTHVAHLNALLAPGRQVWRTTLVQSAGDQSEQRGIRFENVLAARTAFRNAVRAEQNFRHVSRLKTFIQRLRACIG